MLHARNNTILFLWDKIFILMQNIFTVPGMQHGRRAKPLLLSNNGSFVPRFPKGMVEIIVATVKRHNIKNGGAQKIQISK